MTKDLAICWFRQDLRLQDNLALLAACQHEHILPVFILDDHHAGEHALGGASRWWLHYALEALDESLAYKLSVYRGDAHKLIPQLVERLGACAVYWNRCYEPWRVARDTRIKQGLLNMGIKVESFNSSLLWEPWTVHKHDGTPYKVFTPYYQRGCLGGSPPRSPAPMPLQRQAIQDRQSQSLTSLALLPTISWDKKLEPHWTISERGAHRRFEAFLETGLSRYKAGRDFPAEAAVSRLSAYLHFGQISPHYLWHTARSLGDNPQIEHFCRELAWREFSYHLLYHNPDLPRDNIQPKFNRFPWQHNETRLRAWQQGKTGVPIVDAGMRELWQTGYMHNRVRMIVGSFLVKNLLLHWHHGERWFWDCLVDADLASNSASWQWIAGCGADAAPYFRIFNPVTQAEKFDPDGVYLRQYLPELASLPSRYLAKPWEAPEQILRTAGIELGKTYPKPIVELKASREAALAAFQTLKNI